ncbi:hypothetical protein QF035_002665 [Streptomyces umbrinus]|uniref:Transposase n=1 Tax=Streptomyces umbrinus TaxID=67370 RepID=A0ABU0SNG2_9ACTN|nr:hypothetical protein [Streptomyces umbrinus]
MKRNLADRTSLSRWSLPVLLGMRLLVRAGRRLLGAADLAWRRTVPALPRCSLPRLVAAAAKGELPPWRPHAATRPTRSCTTRSPETATTVSRRRQVSAVRTYAGFGTNAQVPQNGTEADPAHAPVERDDTRPARHPCRWSRSAPLSTAEDLDAEHPAHSRGSHRRCPEVPCRENGLSLHVRMAPGPIAVADRLEAIMAGRASAVN